MGRKKGKTASKNVSTINNSIENSSEKNIIFKEENKKEIHKKDGVKEEENAEKIEVIRSKAQAGDEECAAKLGAPRKFIIQGNLKHNGIAYKKGDEFFDYVTDDQIKLLKKAGVVK